MLINGQAFDGTFDYEYTDGQLKMYVLTIFLASLNLDLSGFPTPGLSSDFSSLYLDITYAVSCLERMCFISQGV